VKTISKNEYSVTNSLIFEKNRKAEKKSPKFAKRILQYERELKIYAFVFLIVKFG